MFHMWNHCVFQMWKLCVLKSMCVSDVEPGNAEEEDVEAWFVSIVELEALCVSDVEACVLQVWNHCVF